LLRGALAAWLDSPDRMQAVQAKFRELHDRLKRDTAKLATDAIEKVLAS
jgi:lipid-A-disaccharide synthase